MAYPNKKENSEGHKQDVEEDFKPYFSENPSLSQDPSDKVSLHGR